MDQTAVAEWVVAQVTVRVCPVVSRCTSFRTVVGRTVCNPPVVVRAVAVCTDSAFCADIAHVVVIVPAGIYSRRRIAPALGCLTVGGSIPVYRSIAVGRR